MKLDRKTLPVWLVGLSAAAILAVIFSAPPHTADLCAADNSSADLVKDVLDRVPSDAGFFAHGRAGDLWNTPVVKEMRKTIGAEGEKALKGFEKQMGLLAETVETVTFYYPQMPQGDRDVKTFVVVVITNRPYDRTRILNYLWAKDAKEKDNTIQLQDDFVLHFTNDRTFAVLHKSLVEKYNRGAIKDRKDGPISKALKLATEKHTAVAGLNLSAIPSEIFTDLDLVPQIRPFSPLYRSTAVTLIADLNKNLTLEARLACENASAATDAERSMKLLVKVAEEGLDRLLKDQNALKEIGLLLPVVKEVEMGLKGIKISKNDTETTAVFNLKADMPVGEIIKSTVDKIRANAARRGDQQPQANCPGDAQL